MEGQSEEFQRGHTAGQKFVMGIHANANTMRGQLYCELGNDFFGHHRDLQVMLDNGTDPAEVAVRALVCVEWFANFLTERGLTMCSTEHLPTS